MKHPLSLSQYPGSLTEAGADIASLRLPSLDKIILAASTSFREQSEADEKRKRYRLARTLTSTHTYLDRARLHIDQLAAYDEMLGGNEIVPGYENAQLVLGREISLLRFDSCQIIIRKIGEDVGGRAKQLYITQKSFIATNELYKVSTHVIMASVKVIRAWEISKPYMLDKD